MNATEEILSIRRRIGGMEYELGQLKKRVDVVEAGVLTAPPPAPASTLAHAIPQLPTVIAPLLVVVEPLPLAVPPPVSTPAAAPATDSAPPPLPRLWHDEPEPASDAQPAPAPARLPVLPPLYSTSVADYASEPSFLDQARPWLQRLQLWPPSGGGNTEVQLGAWWATRLGILFAVIGAVFFGVYVSLNTPPLVKFIELCAVAFGVTALGHRLERSIPRFGQVVFAGGLALIFFSALAAYTLPAVKVLDNRLVAAGIQLAVAAAIGWVAHRRNSPALATLAVALGFVAAWFSFFGGFELFALSAALALALVAVVAWRSLRWEAPSLVALVGYWALYATLVLGLSFGEGLAHNFGKSGPAALSGWSWAFLLAGFAVFFWRDDRSTRPDGVSAAESWVQNVNSTAALLLGWLTARLSFPHSLGTFYSIAAVVLGAAAWRRARTATMADVSAGVLLAKAIGAFTLAVIEWLDPRLIALALLVEAGVLLAANRRLRSPLIALGSGLVAIVALAYWFRDLLAHPPYVLSLPSLGHLLTLGGLLAWGLEAARDCGVELEDEARQAVRGAVAVAATLFAFHVAHATTPAVWLPAWYIVGAVVLAVAGWAWRRPEPLVGATVILAGAQLALWQRVGAAHAGLDVIWINTLLVLAPAVVAAWLLGRDSAGAGLRRLAWWISAVVLTALGHAVFAAHGAAPSLFVGLALATTLAVGSVWQPSRRWLWLAVWALGVGVVGHTLATFASRGVADSPTARWLATLLCLVGPAALAAWPRGRAQLDVESPRGGTQWLTVVVGVLFGSLLSSQQSDRAGSLAILGGLSLLSGLLLSWTWVPALLAATWIFALAALPVLLAFGASGPLWAALLVPAQAWLFALGWARVSALRDRWEADGAPLEFAVTTQTWLAGLLVAVVIATRTTGHETVFWFLGAAAVAVAVTRLGFSAVVEVATGFVVLALGYAFLHVGAGQARDLGLEFAAAVATAVAAALLPLVLPAGRLAANAALRPARTWLFSGLGLALVFALMLAQRGSLAPFVTVGWGVGSLAWFGLGLVARSRPDRLLGLVGLALCVPRMFLIDLHSALYRIVAFGALGGVLLWVGFSYHRFRHLIVDDASEAPDGSPKKL